MQVLENQDGEKVTLSSYQGSNPVVLFFYPKAATPGCTAEAQAFRDALSKFDAVDAKVCSTSLYSSLSVPLCSPTSMPWMPRCALLQ